jgi:hypothetical protein
VYNRKCVRNQYAGFLWVRDVLSEKLCQVLFSGTDSPSLKMGMFCRKFVEDVLSKYCFVPRTVLSQGRFITKILGRKIHRMFHSGTFRQGAGSCGIGLYMYTVYSMFLLRGIQLTNVQRYLGSTVKMVLSYKIFTFHEANTFVARTFLVLSHQ